MLNFVTFDISDRNLLENSYNSLKNKESIEVLIDHEEKENVFRKTIDNVKIPNNLNFTFQNLLKLKVGGGQFYIAQCLIDFGYPMSSKGSQSFSPRYSFQILGIAELKVDLGITHLRPESKIDKFVSRFFNSDINFDNAEVFNEKYFIASNKKTEILRYFDHSFIASIAKNEGVLLSTNGTQMFISFDQDLNINQTRIVQEIFSSFKYLADK